MNICVTGGAGFIGSHLVDRLLLEGHRVTVVDNLATGCKAFVNEKALFIEADIRTADLESLFKEHSIDYVFHEAAQTMVPSSMSDPSYDCDVNLGGLIHVLSACKKAGVEKIISASSAAVYGDATDLPLVEGNTGKVSSFYGLTKKTTEEYMRLFYEHFHLPYIALRYANVYGPRQGEGGEGGVISIFAKHLKEGKKLTVFGDGSQTRDFIYVGDVVEANMACLRADSVVGVFNVSTNKGTSLLTLMDGMEQIHQKPIEKEFLPFREGDILHSRLDNSAIKAALHWEAKVELQQGLEGTLAYFSSLEGKA